MSACVISGHGDMWNLIRMILIMMLTISNHSKTSKRSCSSSWRLWNQRESLLRMFPFQNSDSVSVGQIVLLVLFKKL